MASPLAFAFQDILETGDDTTPYRLLTAAGVSTFTAGGRTFLQVEPEALRTLTGYRRTETAKIAVAAQTRSGELLRWIRRANGANHEGLNSTNVVQALLDVLDRLADEGVTLTDADHDAIDRGAEFIALTEEQTAIRRALAAGKVPVAPEEP